MISDCFDNLLLYKDIFVEGFLEFIKNELVNIIDSKSNKTVSLVFLNIPVKVEILTYPLKCSSNCIIESHRTLIDLQLTIEGCEGIEVSKVSLNSKIKKEIIEPDMIIYDTNYQNNFALLTLEPTFFAILFPSDAHKPQVFISGVPSVKKLVVKIPTILLNSK